MGMYDNLKCKYPLPVEGANQLSYQTKSLDCTLDDYEIWEDGTLWHEEYDTEDRSDPNAEGIDRFIGCATQINQRWVQMEKFIGEITFHEILGEEHLNDDAWRCGWIEFSAYFVDGKIRELHLVEHRLPRKVGADGNS